MNDIEKHGTQLARRLAAALEANIVTGPDWPNSQDELTRLQSARVLREMADQIDEFSTAPAVPVPLTHEQIEQCRYEADTSSFDIRDMNTWLTEFVRALERAHNIGPSPQVRP